MPCVGDTPHEMGRFYRSDSSERLLERRKNSGPADTSSGACRNRRSAVKTGDT